MVTGETILYRNIDRGARLSRIVSIFGWLKENWKSMSQLIVGFFAIILALRPKAVADLEEKPLWIIGFPALVGIIAISGFVLSLILPPRNVSHS
jgi:hypothetical protein